jgi:DNA-binding IclR family transcriptional regulator
MSTDTRGRPQRTAVSHAREEAPRDLLGTVSRALDVLETVAGSPQPLSAKAVAQRLGLSLGTSYHVLHTLEHAGYIVRVSQGRFGLGGKVQQLYRLFRDQIDVAPAIRPFIAELAERAREDAYLAIFRDAEVVVADVVEASKVLHIDGLGVGFSRIAHASAIGKVLLASEPGAVVDGYLDERRLAPFTHRTLVERRHIKRHLSLVGELGVATDLQELADGCCCVAVPIHDRWGTTIAAIGLSCPAPRWQRERKPLTALVREIAHRAERSLDGTAVARSFQPPRGPRG